MDNPQHRLRSGVCPTKDLTHSPQPCKLFRLSTSRGQTYVGLRSLLCCQTSSATPQRSALEPFAATPQKPVAVPASSADSSPRQASRLKRGLLDHCYHRTFAATPQEHGGTSQRLHRSRAFDDLGLRPSNPLHDYQTPFAATPQRKMGMWRFTKLTQSGFQLHEPQ